MNVVLTRLAQDDPDSFPHAEQLAAARALLAALHDARLEENVLVLPETEHGTAVSDLGGTWHALTAETDAGTMTVVADVTAVNSAVTATVWALGTEALETVAALARLRSRSPLTACALAAMGLFPPFAALVEELAVERNDRVVMRVLGYALVASIVPPPRGGSQWTLTVSCAGGPELRRGRPLRGDAPVASDARTLLEVTAMGVAALVSRDAIARQRAERLPESRFDAGSLAFASLAVELQRAMWWMRQHRPPFQRGQLIWPGALADGIGVRRDRAVVVLDAMCDARVLTREGKDRFVVPGATARGLTGQK